MSTISFEQFAQEVTNDQALQERLQAVTDRETLVKLTVSLGQERGYSFSANDVETVMERQAAVNFSNQDDEELSDEALEEVAGGWGVFICNSGGGTQPGKPPWWPF